LCYSSYLVLLLRLITFTPLSRFVMGIGSSTARNANNVPETNIMSFLQRGVPKKAENNALVPQNQPNNPQGVDFTQKLPDELLIEIFKKLSNNDVDNLMNVSRKLRSIGNNKVIINDSIAKNSFLTKFKEYIKMNPSKLFNYDSDEGALIEHKPFKEGEFYVLEKLDDKISITLRDFWDKIKDFKTTDYWIDTQTGKLTESKNWTKSHVIKGGIFIPADKVRKVLNLLNELTAPTPPKKKVPLNFYFSGSDSF
jgi:hypothetical protein